MKTKYRKYKKGEHVGRNLILERLEKSHRSFTRVRVQCLDCERVRDGEVNYAPHRIIPRCDCKKAMYEGVVLGNNKVIELFDDGSGVVECLICNTRRKLKGPSTDLRWLKGCFKCSMGHTDKIDRDKAIVLMYENGYTMESIGDILNITRSRVQQIIARDKP